MKLVIESLINIFRAKILKENSAYSIKKKY